MRVTVVRIWLPATIAVVGVALIVFGGDVAQGAGIVLVGVAALVVVANLFMRLSLLSERDREQEEERRQFFSRRGRWPNGRSR
jgi:drug/metabolite transporter (DMT)-like permease